MSWRATGDLPPCAALGASIVVVVLVTLVPGPIFHNILHRFLLSTQAETKDML